VIELWQEFTIEASHNLPQPIGMPVVHGHSYWIRVYIKTEEGNVVPQPMLKGYCEQIQHRLDHQHLNDFIAEPTMEGIAKWILDNWQGPEVTRIRIDRPSVGTGIEWTT